MPEQHDEAGSPSQQADDDAREAPTAPGPAARDEVTPDEPEHDETGLDLARSVARALAGAKRPRARRTTAPRAGRRFRPVDPTASGAHPDDRDPQLLDTTIGRLIAEQGWGTDVRVHGVFTRWDQLVGPEVAQHCTPESYADGKLVVRTDSTAWATQMRRLAPTAVRRLNEELGDGTVTLIDVVGPTGPTWKRGRRSMRDGRGPRDTYG